MSILEGANGRRFIVSGPFDEEMPHYYVVIADYKFWHDNESKIHAWMDENLPRGNQHQQGMVVTLERERDVTAFMLQWA